MDTLYNTLNTNVYGQSVQHNRNIYRHSAQQTSKKHIRTLCTMHLTAISTYTSTTPEQVFSAPINI